MRDKNIQTQLSENISDAASLFFIFWNIMQLLTFLSRENTSRKGMKIRNPPSELISTNCERNFDALFVKHFKWMAKV